MNTDTLICLWILVFPIGIIEVSNPRKFFFILFHFLTWILTTKHLKLFSTYLVGRNGTMWKTCFSAPPKAKKNQKNHKNQVHKRLFIGSSFFEYKVLYHSLRCEHIKDKVYINFNKKKWEIWNFFFTSIRGFNHKEFVSNLHVCINGLGEIWTSYTFHFPTRILTSIPTKVFYIFFLIYVVMSNI